MLDGNARFNLATFVTTWMDDEADKLAAATFDKNMIDKDEYPQTADIEARCDDEGHEGQRHDRDSGGSKITLVRRLIHAG